MPCPSSVTPHAAPEAAGAKIYLADASEFQPDINDAAYLRWSRAIVIRAMYGAQHVDKAWYGGARRDALHAGGVQVLGVYQYLTASQDAAAQAQALVKLLGPLRDGEIPICDLEEGSGDQAGRWNAWQQVILAAYPQLRRSPLGRPMLYAGSYFASTHGLHPDWLAAYQSSEPAGSHILWQFTDSYPVPGVGSCDCSSYRGTTAELAALIRPAATAPVHVPAKPQPAPAPKPAPSEEDGMPAGIIESAVNVRESRTWPAGSVKQIVLWSDWEGLQPAAPIVDLRVAHTGSAVWDAGSVSFRGNTATYTISNPADCNGCSFTRHDSGPATVAFHTLP
jgi:GH25 family lysozyme M1 (1,4-beta-N-acetylmuramidase)